MEHLHLLLGIAVVGEHVNLGDYVEGQLVCELLHGGLLAGQHLAVLFEQFCHGCGTGTAGSLITGHVDAADVADVLQSLQGHYHHDGGAVGVGYDAAGAVLCVLGIALGHYQGHVLVHAECAGVVYHHGTVLGDGLGKLLARAATGAGEGNVHALEVIVVLEEFHFYLLATEGVFGSGAALAAEKQQFVNGEVAFIQNAQEFLTYGTAGAYNRYSHRLSFFVLITLFDNLRAKLRKIL